MEFSLLAPATIFEEFSHSAYANIYFSPIVSHTLKLAQIIFKNKSNSINYTLIRQIQRFSGLQYKAQFSSRIKLKARQAN